MAKLAAPLFALFLLITALGHADESAAFDRAVQLYGQQLLLEAQRAFEALATTAPDDARVQTYLGRLAVQRNEAPVAVGYLEKAAALAPADSKIRQWLGDAYALSAEHGGLFAKMGWANKCRAAYEKSIELDPRNISARVNLTQFFIQAPAIVGGGTNRALTQAQAVKELDPAQGRLLLANIHLADKHYELAFAVFDEVLRENPNDYTALYQLGRIAIVSGQRLADGATALRQCLTFSSPSQRPGPAEVNWRLGTLLEKQGDLTGARAAYEAALAVDGSFGQAATTLNALQK